jgi:hypothetical protein
MVLCWLAVFAPIALPLFAAEVTLRGRVVDENDAFSVRNFDLNVAIERMVTVHGYRFALRGGVDNLTGRANPTAVNNVTGAPQFLQFPGAEGRHFVARIGFFGRAGGK